jgi:hypothetical protein
LSLSTWCCRVILFLFFLLLHIYKRRNVYLFPRRVLLLLFSFCAQQKRGFHSRFLSIQRRNNIS